MTTETSNARGWVLVPREATHAMVMAGGYLHPDQHGDAGAVYSAMLSVAPSAESDAAHYIAELEAAIASAGMDVCESAESDGPFPLILVWTGSGNRPAAPPPAAARGDVRGLVAKVARAHEFFAANSDLRMTTGDHAARAADLRIAEHAINEAVGAEVVVSDAMVDRACAAFLFTMPPREAMRAALSAALAAEGVQAGEVE